VNDDKPAAHIEESQLTASCISSDGHTIALDVFGNKNLELWNWENNSITKIPLRLPYGSVCAIRMFWSPDGNRLAAYLQGASYSMVFYETKSWKPLGHWMCDKSLGSIAFDLFSFDTAGKFYELRRDNIDCVDVGALKGLIN
jgi:WD40 repeat protein